MLAIRIAALGSLAGALSLGSFAIAACTSDEPDPVVPRADAALPPSTVDASVQLDSAPMTDGDASSCASPSPSPCASIASLGARALVGELSALAGFPAVAADEGTVAWVSGTAAANVVLYAQRTAGGPLTNVRTIAEIVEPTGVGLSPDGLELVAVDRSGRPLLFRRATTTDAFARVDEQLGLGEDIQVFKPTFESRESFYVGFGKVAPLPSFLRLERVDGVFRATEGFNEQRFLVSEDGSRKIVTGATPDGLVIFAFDEATSKTIVASRPRRSCTFTTFGEVAARAVQTNEACSNVYSVDVENGVSKLVVSAR